MAFENPLLSAWAQGRPTFGPGVTFPSPISAEIVCGSRPDFVMVDHQHGPLGFDATVEMVQAVSGRGIPAVVRVPTGAYGYSAIERVLDIGALGIVAPVVNTPEDAEQVVRACSYPPRGHRSFGPTRAAMVIGSSDPTELGKVACIIQIESAQGLENVEAIMAVPGIDGVYIGPADLALSLGEPMTSYLDAEDPLKGEPIARIHAACEANGIAPGIACLTGAAAHRYAEHGFRFMTVSADSIALASELTSDLAKARGKGNGETVSSGLY